MNAIKPTYVTVWLWAGLVFVCFGRPTRNYHERDLDWNMNHPLMSFLHRRNFAERGLFELEREEQEMSNMERELEELSYPDLLKRKSAISKFEDGQSDEIKFNILKQMLRKDKRNLFSKIGSGLSGTLSNIAGGVKTAVEEVKTGVGTVVEGTGNLTHKVVNSAGGLTHEITDTAGVLTGDLGNSVGGLTGDVIHTAGGATGHLTDIVGGLTGDLIHTAGGLTGDLTDTVVGLTDDLSQTGANHSILDTLDGLKNGLTGTVVDLSGNVLDTVGLTDGDHDYVEEHPSDSDSEVIKVKHPDDGGLLGGLTHLVVDAEEDLTETVEHLEHGNNTSNETDGGLLHGLTGAVGGLTGGLTHSLEHLTNETKEFLGKAVDALDVTLLDLNLAHLAENLLGTVTNITLTPLEFLVKYGYLEKGEGLIPSVLDLVVALLNFQKMYHLPLTGVLDLHSIEAMLKSRCGMPDIIDKAHIFLEGVLEHIGNVVPISKREISKRYSVPGYKWSQESLTWKIHNYYESSEISEDVQKRAIEQALNLWDEASGLTLSEADGGSGDINIYFKSGDHGDGSQNAFDGEGGVLAHAFYPKSPQSGEAHFDTAERFTDGTNEGVNLKIVAAHEFGHAFGLAHSQVKGALMQPVYHGYVEGYQLPQDDVQGIQKLYGNNDGSVPAQVPGGAQRLQLSPTGTNPVGPAPDSCTVPFRTIVQTNYKKIYVFSENWVWRMTDQGLDEGFPLPVGSVYEGAPEDIQAAFFTNKGFLTYFFKGTEVYVFDEFYFKEKKTITTSGYPKFIQTVVRATDGSICIIQGVNCWTFDEDTLDITSSTPRKLKDVFPGYPMTFDSAVRLEEDKDLFFFYGDNYYRYSDSQKKVVAGYPKPKAGPWMGSACGGSPGSPK